MFLRQGPVSLGNEAKSGSQSCEAECDHIENVDVAQVGIVKSGCVNQEDTTPVHVERLPKLYVGRAGL